MFCGTRYLSPRSGMDWAAWQVRLASWHLPVHVGISRKELWWSGAGRAESGGGVLGEGAASPLPTSRQCWIKTLEALVHSGNEAPCGGGVWRGGVPSQGWGSGGMTPGENFEI